MELQAQIIMEQFYSVKSNFSAIFEKCILNECCTHRNYNWTQIYKGKPIVLVCKLSMLGVIVLCNTYYYTKRLIIFITAQRMFISSFCSLVLMLNGTVGDHHSSNTVECIARNVQYK